MSATVFCSPRPRGERVAAGRVRGFPIGQSPKSSLECSIVLSEKSRVYPVVISICPCVRVRALDSLI